MQDLSNVEEFSNQPTKLLGNLEKFENKTQIKIGNIESFEDDLTEKKSNKRAKKVQNILNDTEEAVQKITNNNDGVNFNGLDATKYLVTGITSVGKLLTPLIKDKEEDPIFSKFDTYFKSVDTLNKDSGSTRYRSKREFFDEVDLVNTKDEKSLIIKDKGEIVYQSNYINGTWKIFENKLSEIDNKIISNLPQSQSEVVNNLSGQELAKVFDEYLANSEEKSGEITWKYGNKSEDVYYFKCSNSDYNSQIIGKNSQGKQIFTATKVEQNRFLIEQNNIPVKHQKMFFKYVNNHEKKQEQEEKKSMSLRKQR